MGILLSFWTSEEIYIALSVLIIILRHPYSLTCCYASVAAVKQNSSTKDCMKKAVEEQLQTWFAKLHATILPVDANIRRTDRQSVLLSIFQTTMTIDFLH